MKNILNFYKTSTTAWDAMLEACNRAETSIDLEEYILDPDKIGSKFINLFIKKAEQGVEVRLLLDWQGCRKLYNSDLHKKLENSGVKVKFFNPINISWIKKMHFFPRDHRKILIVDKKKSFIGGVCIYDDITDWRDTMVEVKDDISNQLLHLFDITWKNYLLTGENKPAIKPRKAANNNEFIIYANQPEYNLNEFSDLLINKIKNAKSSIRLVTPYFTGCKIFMPAIEKAAAKNIKVEIILSDHSKWAPYYLGKNYIGRLIKRGVNIFYYKPIMLHLKMIIIDDDFSAIGSCNLDGLSLLQNHEAMLVSNNKEFIKLLYSHYQEDMDKSLSYSYADWKNQPLYEKIIGRLLIPFKNYL